MKNIHAFSLIVILMIFSCSSNDDNTKQQFVLDNGVKFQILNAQNEDLLNPETEGAFNYSEMKLFYLINGEQKEVFKNTSDQPRNIFLFNETQPSYLGVGTYDGIENFTSKQDDIIRGENIAYIQLSETDTDTLKTLWEYKEDHYFTVKKVWYNGKEYNKDQNFIVRK